MEHSCQSFLTKLISICLLALKKLSQSTAKMQVLKRGCIVSVYIHLLHIGPHLLLLKINAEI